MLAIKRLLTIIIFACCFVLPAMAQQIAFPGAEGYGKYVTGGRGTATVPTTVYAVTSLADDGSPGTLRWALAQTASYRTIVFRISGTIHLISPLKIARANTTIAGQTAPGDGICLADHTVSVSAANVIVRYLRFRLGDRYQNKGMVDGSGSDDAFDSILKNDIIIDHCTISWSTDEALSFYRATNLTLSWNLISEPLNYSYHFETGDADWERHGFGGIWGGTQSSFHHNLLAHCHGRSPRFDGSRNLGNDSTVGLENCDFRNNVIYNWGGYNVNGGEGGKYNIVNNYYKYGPTTRNNIAAGVDTRFQIINPWKQDPLPYGQYYLSGNYVDGSALVTNNNWYGASFYLGALSDTTAHKSGTPFPLMYLPTQTPQDAYNDVLKGAGAILPKRDTLDQRIVRDVINRTGKEIDVQGGYPHGTSYTISMGAWPTLLSTTPPTDADSDGMYDDWETRRGLNPNNAADRAGVNANGYTNIENYLNGDSIVAFGTANACVTAPTLTVTANNNWADAKDTTYEKLMPVDTTNVIASVKGLGNYGNFFISYYTTGTVRTANILSNGVKPYLSRNITIIPYTAGNITGPVTVRLYLTKAEFNALKTADPSLVAIGDLRVLQTASATCSASISGTPNVIIPTASGEWGTFKTGYYIEFQTSAFGSFFMASAAATLPLQLISFTATPQTGKVALQWNTTNEINTSHFDVERSTDGVAFTAIGTVAANLNATTNSYAFVDNHPLQGVAYYRLRMVDKDGAYAYSWVVLVNGDSHSLLSVFPNPANDHITITHPAGTEGTIEIVTIDGKKLVQKSIDANALQTTIDVSLLSKGSYIVVFRNNTYSGNTLFMK